MRPDDTRRGACTAIVCGLLWAAAAHGDAADLAVLPPRLGVLQSLDEVVADVELLELLVEGSRWLEGTQPRTLGGGQLLSWGRCAPMLPVERLELVGGAVVAGTLTAWNDEQVVIVSPLLGERAFPRAAVRGWQRRGHRPSSPASMRGTVMAVLLANGDWLSASHLTLPEAAFGRERAWIVTPADDDSSAAGAAPLRIPADRVVAIRHGEQGSALTVRYPSRRPGARGVEDSPGCVAVAGFQDGSWLPVTAIMPDQGNARFVLQPCLPGGIELPPIHCERWAVTSLLAVGDHVLPMAWLEPQELVHEPRFGEPWPLTRGRSLLDGPLAVRGLHGFTGCGLHAAARVAYQLPVPAMRFLAVVAIDDSAGQRGSVVIRIRAGLDRAASSEVFRSAVLRGGDEPLTVDVPLADVGWLELVVEPTEDGDVLDRTLWLDPRLLTRQTFRTEGHAPLPAASGASRGRFPARP